MALMLTIRKVALPDIKVAMALVLVADPVSFSLERATLTTFSKGAGKGLNVFVYVLCPV
jgi:hypothetical protein